LGIQRLWCDRAATLALLAVVLVVGGCKSKAPKPAPPPVPARLSVAARADVNPDEAGRASPVVLRVYQLKDDAAFRNADFFALFDKEQATLAASLIERQEFVLAPGDQRSNLEYPISGEAKFLAVAAAYRDIRNADWRALTPAPKKTYKNLVKSDQVSVGVEKSRVTLAVSD
jgi:type VI secretion system protein VasD